MSLLNIRPVTTPADVESAARLCTLALPNFPISADELAEHWSTLPEGHRNRRLIYTLDGQDAAYAYALHSYWVAEPERFRIGALVDPACPISLFELAIDEACQWAKSAGAQSFLWWGRSDRPRQCEAIERRGFALEQSNPESCLDPRAFDPAPWLARADRLKGQGVEFLTYEQLSQRMPEAFRDLAYQIELAIVKDIPSPGGFNGLDFDEFAKELELVKPSWGSMWLAMEDGACIAATQLFRNRIDPRLATTGITGAAAPHRRRGLASALKAISLVQAAEMGIEQLWTDNEENNPMWELNQKLGFRLVYRHKGYVLAKA